MSDERVRSKLLLVVEAGAGAPERLQAGLAAADIASVLILPRAGATLDAPAAQPLVALAQAHGAAALLADDANLVRVLKADGVHLRAGVDAVAAYEDARGILGLRFIVGVDPGDVRDDAMTLAELGADYIAFSTTAASPERRDDLIEWWAEIFEVPCVALDVATPAEAVALQHLRADFLGLLLPGTEPPATAQSLVRSIAEALAAAHASAGP